MLNMYIGESEKNVRETFEKAAENRPCIIFFDELDALVPKRGSTSDSSQVMDRIVAELLTQMDMAAKVGGVFVIGATNRPDLLDPSIMRPGRFDKQIYLGICTNKNDRVKILEAQTNKLNLGKDVDFGAVVDNLPPNFTGADFYGLTSKAVTNALNKRIQLIEQGKLKGPES
jgi:peroxin-6